MVKPVTAVGAGFYGTITLSPLAQQTIPNAQLVAYVDPEIQDTTLRKNPAGKKPGVDIRESDQIYPATDKRIPLFRNVDDWQAYCAKIGLPSAN